MEHGQCLDEAVSVSVLVFAPDKNALLVSLLWRIRSNKLALDDEVEAIRLAAFLAKRFEWIQDDQIRSFGNLKVVLLLQVAILDEIQLLDDQSQVFDIAHCSRASLFLQFHDAIEE